MRKSPTHTQTTYKGLRRHPLRSAEKEPYSHTKEPYSHTKEPHLHAKEPFSHTKEPQSHAKEPYAYSTDLPGSQAASPRKWTTCFFLIAKTFNLSDFHLANLMCLSWRGGGLPLILMCLSSSCVSHLHVPLIFMCLSSWCVSHLHVSLIFMCLSSSCASHLHVPLRPLMDKERWGPGVEYHFQEI